MKLIIPLVLACILSLAGLPAMAASLDVVFINPGRTDEPFWRSVTRFMEPAAQQLDIRLEVQYAGRDHVQMIELARQITQRAHKPDYLIIVNEKLAGGEMLKLANQAGIKTLLAFSTFENEQEAEFGVPRRQYPFWLGSITPNASDAGRLAAADLARQALGAHLVGADGKTHIGIIGGEKVTPTGVQRVEGAIAAFEANRMVVLEQVLYAGWDRERAREQGTALLTHYPKLNAIFAASDLMAYGAMDAAEALGRKPGTDLLFSAFNNSPEVLKARVSGRISTLAGGHFTAGAWALVMLYDHANGVDFASQGLQLRLPLFAVLDAGQAKRFLARYGDENFSSVDFRQFSRHLHPALRHYEFGLAPLLRQDAGH